MAERQLTQILSQLQTSASTLSYTDSSALLSKAKLLLLQLNALTPTAPGSASNPSLFSLARQVYEQGALASIRAKNPDAFLRYVSQLQGFYDLEGTVGTGAAGGRIAGADANREEKNKVTGLYLLLLLTQGQYAEFHSELEALSTRLGGASELEADRFLDYPIKLERWLMEGSYDRVWKAMKKGEVPCEEYGVFSEILTFQIRSEIASSSERAYPSLPISSTKSLLFLESEGEVVEFARSRGWILKDGHIIFPSAEPPAEEAGAEQEKPFSQLVIENALGYARELETIV
ncbi:SAC3/GANP/Nin1/mts3/eIF-3 p25 family-domain-containing protein [Pseudoneurospora amorphoporcata]|uniref:SAC3/GANP/Nin1/mts3/eIF-3 p25 family-domain-containing protein n=1 Tax=Pseudoneurospora amorphoporcata TaxID=241081 RepID=A0AAN6SIN8_9PEZI|nr:SAC3/GANP/Nin1/mts3/eIF-3 p25 family-domain-containing protein [Pseudoneurospora amorphoporcata]